MKDPTQLEPSGAGTHYKVLKRRGQKEAPRHSGRYELLGGAPLDNPGQRFDTCAIIEPVAGPATAIQTAQPLRDDALGADLAHRLQQLTANADHVVDHDDPLAAGGADDVAPQRLEILDRAGPQIMAVEVEQVEGEISEPLGPALAHGLGQQVDMGDAALSSGTARGKS
jgi:hypothetical protein